ncbi:MAG: helix-turn-helix transcriptional regulator [Fimbriimonadales bacterium]
MHHEELATVCRALGDPTRAHIFKFLLGCCCPVAVQEGGEVSRIEDVTAGTVCCHVTGGEKVTSTISFHLKELRNAGLITMERRGKHMICAVDRQALAKVGEFFRDALRAAECCPGD